MGNDQSQENTDNLNKRKIFRNMFHNNYILHQTIVHETFGSVDLYKDKNSNSIDLIVKEFYISFESELENIFKKLERRIQNPHSNLLRIYDAENNQIQGVCGKQNSLKIYIEYVEGNLKKQIKHRRKYKNYFFSEVQLWKILQGLISALVYLHDLKQFHGEVKVSDVLVTKKNTIKLIDKTLIIQSNWKIGQKGPNVAILKGKGILFAPSIMKCLENNKTQINAYDPFEADIFSMGMILLQTATLEDADQCYDYENFLINRQKIDSLLSLVFQKYSTQLANTMESMLCDSDDIRPSAQQLLRNLCKTNSETLKDLNTTLNESFLTEDTKKRK